MCGRKPEGAKRQKALGTTLPAEGHLPAQVVQDRPGQLCQMTELNSRQGRGPPGESPSGSNNLLTLCAFPCVQRLWTATRR